MVSNSRNKRIRLFYLGSGDIGVPVAESLASCPDIELVGCATQPDRPKGRKRILTPTPIGLWCNRQGLEPKKPESVNSQDFIDLLQSLDLDLITVFSFGQILREPILTLPRYGCLNIHTSLLPKYRGASPISAAIIAGDDTTGLSFMKMDRGLDTGPIYQQVEMHLPDGITAVELQNEMAVLAAEHIVRVVKNIVHNGQTPRNQGTENITYARKIKKDDGRISWTNEASFIERQIRAFYPWPGAWFIFNTSKIRRKITISSAIVDATSSTAESRPGTVCCAGDEGWGIVCGKDILVIKRLMPEGKKEMDVADYLRGNPVKTGSIILE